MKALIKSRMPVLKSAALATALAAGVLLLVQPPVHAGTNAAAVEATRAKDQQERQDRQDRQQQREQREQAQPRSAPPPVSRVPQQQGPQNGGAPPSYRPAAQPNRPAAQNYRPPAQSYGGNDRRDGWRDDRRPGNGNVAVRPNPRTDGYRQPPPRQVVPRLPPGYRQYAWRGSNYYNYGGRWYRPYGGSYVVIGAPYGLFVNYLPSYYSTTWIGGNRYYYADDTYYLYEPQRRGYIVTRSPYDDARDEDEDSEDYQDEDLFIYPMRGQSEKQQADDRYECHRWAADETHYDPTDADYDREDREKYDRAITACLTGRGYSVK